MSTFVAAAPPAENPVEGAAVDEAHMTALAEAATMATVLQLPSANRLSG